MIIIDNCAAMNNRHKYINYVNAKLMIIRCYVLRRGHPFMTSAPRGRGTVNSGRLWTEGVGGTHRCGRPQPISKAED
jgi:hypothetical protein